MANNQSSSPTVMTTSMNMTVTIFGFVLSALFMFVICCRLLCFRFRQSSTLEMLQQSVRRSSPVERTVQGLDTSTIASFPTINYSQPIFVSEEDNLCTICLGDYKEKEALRVLPKCGHAFHVNCIDVWLRQHFTCPVCRISLRLISALGQLMPNYLISLTAKARFIPGALPDSMFEQQPLSFQLRMPNLLFKESNRAVGSKEMVDNAESSLSNRANAVQQQPEHVIRGREAASVLSAVDYTFHSTTERTIDVDVHR